VGVPSGAVARAVAGTTRRTTPSEQARQGVDDEDRAEMVDGQQAS
jgi:hypothetical protein